MAATLLQFLEPPTRFYFFTGKGGVGKTSLACSTALALAESGKRVLLISTDPASNLDEVLGVELESRPTPIPSVNGLEALNLDPVEAAAAYREKVVGPMRGLLPENALQAMEEQLSGACTMEIATFDEFARWLGDPEAIKGYDHLIFDTAPTGHTLRLLALPKAWTHFFDSNTSGSSCLGPLAGLEQQRGVYEAALKALANPDFTTLLLVARPQPSSLQEAERSAHELAALGVHNQRLLLNGLFTVQAPEDPYAAAMQERGRAALQGHSSFINQLPSLQLPLRSTNLVGLDALRAMANFEESAPAETIAFAPDRGAMESLADLIDGIESAGRGVVLTMGKGGVGKTTAAAAIATELARRGHPVHLSTTDPAPHLQAALPEAFEGLSVSPIDPVAETEAYVAEVMEKQGANLDEAGRSLLLEDLRSPCTEEIAVFRAFARTVAMAEVQFVILDTAPTGHTLLLLDATQTYHRELGRQSGNTRSDAVNQLLPRLRNPDFTRVILVALPEPTPIHEAMLLGDDLQRAGITPYAWIINQALHPLPLKDPCLIQRAQAEIALLEPLLAQAPHPVVVPWQLHEPTGATALGQLTASATHPAVI